MSLASRGPLQRKPTISTTTIVSSLFNHQYHPIAANMWLTYTIYSEGERSVLCGRNNIGQEESEPLIALIED